MGATRTPRVDGNNDPGPLTANLHREIRADWLAVFFVFANLTQMPERQLKSHIISFWLSKDERAVVALAAEGARKPLSAFCRDTVVAVARELLPAPPSDADVAAEPQAVP